MRIGRLECGFIKYSTNAKWVFEQSYCYEGCYIVELGPVYITWLRGECRK